MINTISFPNINLSFDISRIAFCIGSFNIYWYGILIALGILLAVCYGIHECKKVNLSTDDFFNMFLIALPTAIICARLYYVIFSWNSYSDNILSILDIRNGGLAVFGGIIGAAAVIIIYCLKNKINIGTVLDILAIGLLIGQAIGRWGNFINAEAFGAYTNMPWAMTIKNSGKIVAESVHPTFLYESLWNAAGIAVLLLYKKIKEFNGEIFCGYLVWYGIGRSVIEGLRADSLYIGALRVSQLLAVICIVVGITTILYKRIKNAGL